MATRRMLGKTASISRKLNKVSDFAALLWSWTLPHCDDLGHMDGSPEMIKGIVIPLRTKTIDEVASASSELESVGLWKFYEFEGEKYLEVAKWEEYQTFKNDRDLQIDFPLAEWNPKKSNRNPEGKIVRRREGKVREGKVREGKVREGNEYTSDFESFWKIYPKKVGKPKAFDLWKSLTPEEVLLVMADIPKRAFDDKWISGYIKDPERYIRNRQWEDDIIRPKGQKQAVPERAPKASDRRIEDLEDTRSPEEKEKVAKLFEASKKLSESKRIS